jgi:hypothetical protein
MTLFKKLLLVNVCGIVGAILSLFIVPDSANFWLWLGTVAVVICLLNLLVFTRRKLSPVDSPEGAKSGTTYLIISLILTGIALALQLVRR